MQNIKIASTFFIMKNVKIKNVKNVKKRDINKKRKKRFLHLCFELFVFGYHARLVRFNESRVYSPTCDSGFLLRVVTVVKSISVLLYTSFYSVDSQSYCNCICYMQPSLSMEHLI